jgi:hypothetical protein
MSRVTPQTFRRRPLRLIPIAGALGGLALITLPAASAAALDTAPCSDAALSQPFTQFGDTNDYALVPGGDFEAGLSGWTLTGAAGVVAGSEPYAATGTLGQNSMAIPAGSSVTSPAVCVDAGYPDFRFFALNDSATSTLVAHVVYTGPKGGTISVPVGVVSGDSNWEPSAAMHTGAVIASALADGAVNIELRFTSLGGESQIDDVFLDPRLSH